MLKPSTIRLIKAFRQFARPPFARSAKDDRRMKTNTGPFSGGKNERDARAKELRAERARVGSLKVRRAYRHYFAGRTSHGNNCLGIPTIIACYTFA
mgnify:FL=1